MQSPLINYQNRHDLLERIAFSTGGAPIISYLSPSHITHKNTAYIAEQLSLCIFFKIPFFLLFGVVLSFIVLVSVSKPIEDISDDNDLEFNVKNSDSIDESKFVDTDVYFPSDDEESFE
ncbi:11282_t:CDS:2 [Dentiscutata erythropus]|uniref:11282_t:CDS:1 n=1 Tax=Dentiscutata erythropus TaxID=1348616 RepID=A0A9N9D253_9GLOM|nr:11282_t:CDS:2 [Dentiscutata erythropus]